MTLAPQRTWNHASLQSIYFLSLRTQPASEISSRVSCGNDYYGGARSDFRVSGILHTIFFHRYFPSIRPSTTEVLDLTLPYINDVELETLIDTRVSTLIHQLSSSTNAPNGGPRAQIAVQFFEKRRRKSAWFGGLGGTRGEEEICWEVWSLDVTIATPRTEAGTCR